MIVDVDGRIRAISPALASVFGYTPAELQEKQLNCLVPQAEEILMSAATSPAIPLERPPCEGTGVTAVHRSGEPFLLSLLLTKVSRSDGSQYFVVCVPAMASEFDGDARDTFAESFASHDARQLRAILDNTVEGIVTIDELGYIEVFNHGAEKLFGYQVDEVLGRNVSMLMPTPFSDEHDGYLARYRATGEKHVIGIGREVVGRRKDGTTFAAELSIGEVQLTDRRLFTGVVRDISERKRMEERLVQSERLSAIGEAMTGLVHESRNALQRGQACLEMLKLHLASDKKAMDLINKTQVAQNDLHRLYEDVREYARPIVLRRSRNRLEGIITEAWENLATQRNGRQAEMRMVPSRSDISLDADRFAIRCVFQNLFENSLAACPDPVMIRTELASTVWNRKPAVRVIISDNGPGLPPDKRRCAFEPFFTTKTRGTGLGLAICRRLVQAHGGEVSLLNSASSGAVLEIILPRDRES